MTPLVAAISKRVPDPEKGHWFDLGELPTRLDFELEPELMVHLPYDSAFIVGRCEMGDVVLRLKTGDGAGVAVAGFIFDKWTTEIDAFAYLVDEEGRLAIGPEGVTNKPWTIFALSAIDSLVRRLDVQQTAYVMEPKLTFTSQRKMRQGKKPTYEWRTVEVAPRRVVSVELGGTHASPRAHERRGHWRSLPKGRVWIRPCIVGSPADGQVFHDYKVSGVSTVQESQ